MYVKKVTKYSFIAFGIISKSNLNCYPIKKLILKPKIKNKFMKLDFKKIFFAKNFPKKKILCCNSICNMSRM